MTKLQMKIEPYAGSDIKDVCNEAVRIAKKLYVDIWFEFNGVQVLARPTDNPLKIVDDFHRSINSKSKHKIATAKS